MDVEDLIGLDADNVYTKRVERDPRFWTLAQFNTRVPSTKWGDSEIFDAMMRETMRLHTR